MPKPGFKSVTIPEDVYDSLQEEWRIHNRDRPAHDQISFASWVVGRLSS